jgi:hypothetical protein
LARSLPAFSADAIGAKASEFVTTGFMVIAALLSWYRFHHRRHGPR